MGAISTLARTAGSLMLAGASALAWSEVMVMAKSTPKTGPDQTQSEHCGSESVSAGDCYTHWCVSYDPRIQSEPHHGVVCHVRPLSQGGVLVDQSAVAWWGWENGRLGDATLHGFWVRDYRLDPERNACGVNCTRYGSAIQIKAQPDCYLVKQNWTTASEADMPAHLSKPKDGWLVRAYCMRPIASEVQSELDSHEGGDRHDRRAKAASMEN